MTNFDVITVSLVGANDERIPAPDIAFEIDLHGESEGIETIVREVLSEPQEFEYPSHFRDRNERHANWGASASALEISLTVASYVLLPVATVLIEKVASRLVSDRLTALTEDRAIEVAKYRVATRYAAESRSLVVVGYSEDVQQSTVSLKDSVHAYKVTMSADRNNNVTVMHFVRDLRYPADAVG